MDVDGTRIYLRLLRHVQPYWHLFAVGLAAMVVLACTEPALAALLKPTFDGSFVEKNLDRVAVMPGLLVVLIVKHFSARLRAVSFEMQRLMGLVTHEMQETLEGQEVIRSFGAQEHERNRFSRIVNRVRQYEVKFASAASLIAPIAHFVTAVGLAALIYLAAREAADGTMAVGAFASFFSAMGLLFGPLKRLTGVNARLQRGIAAAASVFALIDQPSETDNGSRTMGHSRRRIDLDDVVFRYDHGEVPALEGVRLSNGDGERLALVGPSGSGKSTIANLIPRFYVPDSGRILLDGINLQDLTLASLREQISLISQEMVLFEGSVRENVVFDPLAKNDEDALQVAIDSAHAREFIEALPRGLDTEIGQHGVRLSGGQRQRLAIARAFLNDAPVLILDEATSSLDNQSEQEIKHAVSALSTGRTTVIIAHRIVVLEAGRIVDVGSHDQLLARKGLYASLYRFQYGRTRDALPRPATTG